MRLVFVAVTSRLDNGNKHGHGKMTYVNQEIYDGEWKNDKRYGKGKLIFPNGDVFIGEWGTSSSNKKKRDNDDTAATSSSSSSSPEKMDENGLVAKRAKVEVSP